MLDIPTNLASWHPNDVTRWLRDVEDDPEVTDQEHAQAQRAVSAALLGEDIAAEIHGAPACL